jgi:hypothetical protein
VSTIPRETQEHIHRLYAEGHSLRRVARLAGVHPKTAARYVGDMKREPGLGSEARKRLRRLYEAGETWSAIREATGVSLNTIARVCADLPKRRPTSAPTEHGGMREPKRPAKPGPDLETLARKAGESVTAFLTALAREANRKDTER